MMLRKFEMNPIELRKNGLQVGWLVDLIGVMVGVRRY